MRFLHPAASLAGAAAVFLAAGFLSAQTAPTPAPAAPIMPTITPAVPTAAQTPPAEGCRAASARTRGPGPG